MKSFAVGLTMHIPTSSEPVFWRLQVKGLSSSTSRWQNYGVFVWQWEDISLIITNSPYIAY